MFILTACAPAQNVGALPLPDATSVVILPEATATSAPLLSTPTVEPTKIPCDPHAVDFCITDGHFILQRPIDPSANDSVDVSYRYASTENGTREPHHGVEFLNSFGTPIHAAADGVVIFAGPDVDVVYGPWPNFYGNLVVLKHDNDLYTLYAHLSKIDVQTGDVVQMGEKIGEVGQSGVATGSHLHFEVRRGNVQDYFATQNPELWLIPEVNDQRVRYGVAVISIIDVNSTFHYAELTLKHSPTPLDALGKTYYLNTYVDEMVKGAENAAISNLLPGRYRIALKLNGYLYERWVEVQSGKLTQVIIVVK